MRIGDLVPFNRRVCEERFWDIQTAVIKRFIQSEFAGVDLNGSE